MARPLRNPPGAFINDLRYDPLGAFIVQRLDQGLPNSRERPAGMSGLDPVKSPLALPPGWAAGNGIALPYSLESVATGPADRVRTGDFKTGTTKPPSG
ncbi:hypothetical protein SAMN05428945_1539 [Streptomyces sp. 2224.1]|nr:hypothetical protein BX261_3785 [Streptomyces sp. 2321.6]SDR38246.1 hypothetical protein SAMN05216511_3413 [Streptomyces sp. KS_16]SEB92200.1 hypothetical protein SAMN05428945_1539 [Streptomyces sp. 2224.1]SED10215.1 hypothetical protein SAMN05428940_3813 [Streptomyces sp. 2133.1]SEE68087.1 hypothetical protein SAMN05428954_3461 [Streptomyces sp. 2112.3]SNC69904.1 hypothetical protein SAMN06272741_3779 [Streptomyces sp. 2114.4]